MVVIDDIKSSFNDTIFSSRFVVGIARIDGKVIKWSHIIPFNLPLWMYILGGLPFGYTMLVWLVTLLISSFFFMVFGLTAGHHGHTNFFEGDIPR